MCSVFLDVQRVEAANPAKEFAAARAGVLALEKDAKRSLHRDQWLKYTEAFDALYEKNPKWDDRVSALYRAAAAYDGLARKSRRDEDAEKAVSRYELLAEKHADNSLADDALFDAAKLVNVVLKDPGRARELISRLEKNFPKGDQLAAAKAYASRLGNTPPTKKEEGKGSARIGSGKADDGAKAGQNTTQRPGGGTRITQVGWQSRKNLVRITIDLDRATSWAVYSQKPDPSSGRPARLVVDLANAAPDSRIKPGARVSQSLLTRLRVNLTSFGNTRLLLDFSDIKRFTVKAGNADRQLVISVTDKNGVLPNGNQLGEKVEDKTPSGPSQQPGDMAAQLGLNVRTVIVDAGHGGNDPGTEHNGVVERVVTLTVAQKVVRELKRLGFDTRLTRTGNTRIELADRAKIANQAKGDVLVSIHVNASPLPDTQGFETYFLDFASSSAAGRLAAVENTMGDKNLGEMERIMADLMLGARTQESRRLATAIQNSTVAYMRKKKLAIRDGGLRSAPFLVLLGSGMPGVLVELGYCTNKTEASRLKDEEYLDALARGIAEGIKRYASRLGQ